MILTIDSLNGGLTRPSIIYSSFKVPCVVLEHVLLTSMWLIFQIIVWLYDITSHESFATQPFVAVAHFRPDSNPNLS